MMEVLEVTKHYPQGRRIVKALQGVSLRIDAGEFVSIMGPSGSGKSTLMHLLGALDTPTTGQVFFQKRALHSMSDRELSLLRRSKLGFVFQFFNLLPTLTAEENVALPLLLAGQSAAPAAARAVQLLTWVHLEQRRTSRPSELSGGEMQRVALARALANDPPIVLADEPTGNLDSANGRHIMDLLRTVHDRRKTTVVLVTHDRELAAMADARLVLRDGRVVG